MVSLKLLISATIAAYPFTKLLLEKVPDNVAIHQNEHGRWTVDLSRSYQPQPVINNQYHLHTNAEAITNHVSHHTNHHVNHKHTSNRNIGWNVGNTPLKGVTTERLLDGFVNGFQHVLSMVTGQLQAPPEIDGPIVQAHASAQKDEEVHSLPQGKGEDVEDTDAAHDAV